jgi:dUTP pyrophosphatase
MVELGIKLDGGKVPEYKTVGSAGADIFSSEYIKIDGGDRALVRTGIYLEIPEGYEVQIRPRSGLALKSGITVLNTPGTIDSDYKGEIGIVLFNTTDEPFEVHVGDRIAQMVLAPVVTAKFNIIDKLSDSIRGTGGYGSTGK